MTKSFLTLALYAANLIATLTYATPVTERDGPSGPLALPFPVSDFTMTAASVRNTYCGPENNRIGIKIGDQTLLKSYADSTPERVNIYRSDSLGIIVAYMGTNLANNVSLLANIQNSSIPANEALGLPPRARVLEGSQNIWNLGWNEVKVGLHQARQASPGLPIVVTGHSHGGGTCLLAAMSIAKEFGADSISKVIAFAPPRVGNKAFADAFDSVFKGRYTGVTNGADWVSEVPPMSSEHRHPSGMVWISPPNSTSWGFYPDQEDLNGIDSRTPKFVDPKTGKIYYGDHFGEYKLLFIYVYVRMDAELLLRYLHAYLHGRLLPGSSRRVLVAFWAIWIIETHRTLYRTNYE